MASGQTVQASVSAVVGATVGVGLNYELCYAIPGGTPQRFTAPGLHYLSIILTANEQDVITSTLTVQPPAGVYDVGLCGWFSGTLDRNDYANGVVTVF